jgi:YgiT-type zinc finger domain-containing protein
LYALYKTAKLLKIIPMTTGGKPISNQENHERNDTVMKEKVCFYCKGTLKPNHNTHFSELDNCMVIVKNVPCFVCSQCGEVVYTMTMVEQLEKIIDSVKAIKTEVVIMDYARCAA